MAEQLTAAVSSGDRRRALVALRDHLAAVLEAAAPSETASLARQLVLVLRELVELGPSVAVDTDAGDDFLDRLERRNAAG